MAKALIPEFLQRRIQELPQKPGVYLFKDRDGETLYIGKALSIQKRVRGHFRFFGENFSKEGTLLSQTHRIDILETSDEAEALLLEASLIKEMRPKYNQALKDDKSYPYLKITAEDYPRLLVVRQRKADGGHYFGPFTNATLLKKALRMLRRQFPLRTCRAFPKKVCLMYHLKQCGGPCEALQSREDYAKTVSELERFLEGRREALLRNLSKRMREHASARDYEKAQTLLGQIQALSVLGFKKTMARNRSEVLVDLKEALSLPRLPLRMECFDISNIQGHEAVASMVVFCDGKPFRSGYRRFRIRTVEGIDDYRMMKEVITRRYGGTLAAKTPAPDLIVIDGGKGHLAAAKAALDTLGLFASPIISIAKQHEHIFSTGRSMPHILPPTSAALQLIRHLRDEAHRFAIGYHRLLRQRNAFRR